MVLSPTFLRFIAVFAIIGSLISAKRVFESFDASELYRKDFMQEYVLARAVLDGEELYVVFPVLVAKYFDPMPMIPMTHPTSHTPVAAVLSVPLGFFSYPVAAIIWIVVELFGLAIAIEMLSRWWGERVAFWQKVLLFFVCLGIGPVVRELFCGQYNFALLILLLIAWLAMRRGHDVTGGASLGIAIALKLTAWPLVVFFVLRGRWRAVLAAAAVAVGLSAIAAFVVGWRNVADYYTIVGPEVAKQYRQHESNYSLWTIGPRFFSPEAPDISCEFTAAPPWPSARLDRLATFALPGLAFAAAMILAWRCKQFDSAFGILLCASLPINPVAWDHYLILTAIPIAIVFRRLKDAAFPKALTAAALVALALTALPNVGYIRAAAQLFTIGRADNVPVVPFAVGLITYLPLAPLGIWIALLWKTDSANPTDELADSSRPVVAR